MAEVAEPVSSPASLTNNEAAALKAETRGSNSRSGGIPGSPE
jgi:hypothetical protein